MSLRDECAEVDEEMILYDGLDNAVIGYSSRCGEEPVAIYDYEKMVECFVDENDWSREEAVEWISFNIENAWIGPRTPHILYELAESLHYHQSGLVEADIRTTPG